MPTVSYTHLYLGHLMGVHIEADMRTAIFAHMQKLGFSFYDKNRTGLLMSRVTTDLFDITELAHHGPEDLFISIVTLTGSFLVLWNIQKKLALVLMIAVPMIVLFVAMRRRNMMKVSRDVKRRTAGINAVSYTHLDVYKRQRIQRHRVNAGRSLPSQIGALPIGILNRHLGQQFGLLVFGRVKIEELIFHISFKIADSNPAPSVVPFLNDCDRASIVIFAERRAVRRFFRAQIQSIRRNRIMNLRRRIAVVVIARPLIQHRGVSRYKPGIFPNLNAVSYTHLDVYKRQLHHRRGLRQGLCEEQGHGVCRAGRGESAD